MIKVWMLFPLLCLAQSMPAAGLLPKTNQPPVQLAWDADSDPTVVGYNLYQGSSSADYTNVFAAGSNLSFTVSNLVAGATYFFAVTGYNAAGLESGFSTEVSYFAAPPPTNPPSMKPIVILTVQVKSSVSGQWVDTGMSWDLDPVAAVAFYRTKITQNQVLAQSTVIPSVKVRLAPASPPAPGAQQ